MDLPLRQSSDSCQVPGSMLVLLILEHPSSREGQAAACMSPAADRRRRRRMHKQETPQPRPFKLEVNCELGGLASLVEAGGTTHQTKVHLSERSLSFSL